MVGKLSFHFWWNPVSALNYLETLSRGARFWGASLGGRVWEDSIVPEISVFGLSRDVRMLVSQFWLTGLHW